MSYLSNIASEQSQQQLQETPVTVEQKNTSGTGDQALVPDEVKGWSWGGFLLGWIWGVVNNVWISLLCFLPVVSLVMAFVLGARGKEWAWKYKKWESVEKFNKAQRAWAIWGFVFTFLVFAVIALIFLFTILILSVNPKEAIQKAECVKTCEGSETYDACVNSCVTPISAGQTSSRGFNYNLDYSNLSTPTPTPLVTPTPPATNAHVSTPTPSPVTTTQPSSSNFQSYGSKDLDDGVSATVTSANLSSDVVTINITFKNNTSTTQTAKLLRVQMHDNVYGTGIREGYITSDLVGGQSKSFTLSFDALPTPPFKIQYAMPNGDLVDLGTIQP